MESIPRRTTTTIFIKSVVRHRALAGDGQRAVAGHDPVDIGAAGALAIQVVLEMDGGTVGYTASAAVGLQPVDARAVVVHIGQRRAVGERIPSNTGDAAGDGHAGQRRAAVERILPDAGDAVLNHNRLYL